MKRIQTICILFLLISGMCLPALHAQSYDKLWKQVEQAQKKSLPQTVIKLTNEIYRKSEREKNAPQMLKAAICRDTYQESLTPDSFYVNLKNMELWAQSEQNPVNKAILHSLLARDYADYMRSNRRTLLSRTALDAADDLPPTDIREWSANLFIDKIDEYSRASLQDSTCLLEISSKDYVPFVILEDGSRFYQHDMYHLLASRAVSTYENLAGFEVDSLVRIRINDIYGNMINAYRHRAGSEDAALLCSLNYWDWKVSGGISSAPYSTFRARKERINKEYLQALNNLIKEYGSREVCAEAYIKKAIYLRNPGAGRPAEALQVCDEGLKRYPAYKRINELKNIREGILQPRLYVNTQGSIYPGDSLDLNVQYRNLGGVTLNLYRTDLSEVPYMDTGINKTFYQKHTRKLSSVHFALKPIPVAGVAPEDMPYQHSDTTFKLHVPDDLGVYVLQVVPDAKTARTAENFLVSTRFKVLTLSLRDNKMEVVTVDSHTGQPISGTQVSFYSTYDEKARKELFTVTTDAQGKALVEWNRDIRSYVARKGSDSAMLPQTIYHGGYYERGEGRPEEQVTLLTDRSLYRPGQIIYVKGIAYEQASDSAHVLEGKAYQIRLLDVNRKELALKDVKTNDFGSFTTEFVLPTVCLNGFFTIEVSPTGSSVPVRVEDYKRPTFDITFNPVKQAYSLGDTVNVTGNVKAYNGVAVQDVPLAYTIVRSNLWGNWEQHPVPLVSDTLQLDAEGNFSIPVALKPDEDFVRYERYSYRIETTVTGDAGETQTAQYVLSAARQAYFFVSDISQELCKEDSITATLSVENAINQTIAIEGICRLYPITDFMRGKIADKPVYEGTFVSGEQKDLSAWKQLPSGRYRLILSVRGSDGKEVSNANSNYVDVTLFSLSDSRLPVFMENFLYEKNTEFDATHPAVFYFGTSCKDTYILVDIFGREGRMESTTLQLSDSIVCMEYPYKEAYGDGIAVQFTFVKNGQMYARRVELRKRLPDRTLDMKWEVFRDRLRPGQKEEWKLIIKTPQGIPAAAEMLATMYDASLDQIYKRTQLLRVFYNRYIPYFYWNDSNAPGQSYSPHFPVNAWKVPAWHYDYFYTPYSEVMEVVGYGVTRKASVASGIRIRGTATKSINAIESTEESGRAVELKYVPAQSSEAAADMLFESEVIPIEGQTLQPVADLRTNFAETAFFYPQLRTNEQGEIAFSFTMPQSLTRWNFRGYSHTKDMMTGMLDATVVTAKEFMLTPNMPRFVRVGDKTEIAASIANLTGKALKGTATFTLFDPMTQRVISTQRQKFSVEAGKTTPVSFRFDVTDRYDLLGVRMIADGGTFSDGEQHLLPVLSNKAYITETLAMPVRGEETRTFSLDSLFNDNSRTATDRRLTVEFTGNPAWYAVQALPVLSQPTGDNAVSWATAYYANSLAGYIANSQPRIKTVFDSWRAAGGTKETFLSQLQKNQDVKNILLDESPWLLEATTEAEQQVRIATLFDINQLNNRNLSSLTKLRELQDADGSWSWYKGMSGSRSITGYITELLVRLPLLTKTQLPDDAADMKQKAFSYLQKEALEEYRAIRKAEKNGTKITTLSDATMRYLYLVALSGESLLGENATAYYYFLTKIARNLENGTMECKAQSAIILMQVGRKAEANEFIASIREHLVQTDEMGAHFAFYANPYNWDMLPVPAHVEVMEALRMAGGNDALVEEMKLWLLKQKQTTSWNSPVATADAVYALLCQGDNLLDSRGDVCITLGNKVLETLSPAKTTVPELGYIKETFTQGSTELKAKSITVEKRDAGIAWGAVYAQYLSPISDVKQQGGELNVEKKLYVERTAANGQKSLQPITVTTQLAIGDKVVSRLTISLDRAMDFIQLKDQRGACFEPVGALSGYRWSNGLGYYAEVEDAATNFFFDHLGKGVYVLEHSYRIARGGTYETGVATIQCAYAPEYASHSAGGTVVIK